MIRETVLGTASWDEDVITEPPSGELSVTVIGNEALLAWYVCGLAGTREEEPSCSFQVPARSLLLALRAAWDDAHPGTADIDPPNPSPRRERGPRPEIQPPTLDR